MEGLRVAAAHSLYPRIPGFAGELLRLADAHDQGVDGYLPLHSNLDTTHGQIDGLLSQLPSQCHLPEVAPVGDWLKICP